MRGGLAQQCGRSRGSFDISPASQVAERVGLEFFGHAQSSQSADFVSG
jgi:hypothetical protein